MLLSTGPALLAAALMWTPLCAQHSGPDEILAVAEKHVITSSDLDFYIFEARVLNPDFILVPEAELSRRFLSDAIDEYLLAGWAEFQLKQVPEEAIEARLRSAMERYERLAGGSLQWKAMLADARIDEQEFRLWARRQAKRSFMIREVLSSYADLAGASPADGELRDAARLRIAHILVEVRGRGELPEALGLETALRIRRDIQAGVTFSEGASLYSDDELTAMDGGELGWFARDAIAPELWEAAVKTKRSEASPPVRTRAGFHILLVLDYETPAQQEYYLKLREEERRQILMLRSKSDIRLREGYELLPIESVRGDGPAATFWEDVETKQVEPKEPEQ